MKRYVRNGLLLLAGTIAGYLLASGGPRAERAGMLPGHALVRRPVEEIMLVAYSTKASTMVLQRSAPGADFLVQATFSDGRPPHRCVAPARLGELGALSQLSVRRALSLAQRDKEFPVFLGVLDVRDRGVGEPDGPMLVFTNTPRTAIAFIVDRRASEMDIAPGLFHALETGCAALAQP